MLAATALRLDAAEATGKIVREYDLKAAFLFNFTHFVEWPPEAFTDNDAPIVIGILGDDPFGPVLDRIIEGETIRNRKLVIKRSRRIQDLKACHVLFISKSEKGRIGQILTSLDGTSVFTIGEVEGFARRGGITNLFLQGNKVRFEINVEAAKRKGLKVNAQLLALGTVVGPQTAKEIN
ncbi:MAG TPA: YfiR family protein [Verrucomicrobiae bacterium]|nr:YfiR family protein [Verrucomicrobiae bacterium]